MVGKKIVGKKIKKKSFQSVVSLLVLLLVQTPELVQSWDFFKLLLHTKSSLRRVITEIVGFLQILQFQWQCKNCKNENEKNNSRPFFSVDFPQTQKH